MSIYIYNGKITLKESERSSWVGTIDASLSSFLCAIEQKPFMYVQNIIKQKKKLQD